MKQILLISLLFLVSCTKQQKNTFEYEAMALGGFPTRCKELTFTNSIPVLTKCKLLGSSKAEEFEIYNPINFTKTKKD